ncbi:DUF1684 domain-containing protein [Paeniglutamicibacter kerguelensis]|uniref:Uncharacterized protein (DUF1684 family) n=1 Tax=Paeniglutamicibacter kerguelensis TaxID=254788 RepID=A0ABS4XJ79_9MICC|nr:DUF1684 domain-containing protein [Paeniglutamicibacter kerguelensis]MBP2388529.1 uncharacterized protein (DUF1684 family) [Paeniglutamicibacter kerguelensis]
MSAPTDFTQWRRMRNEGLAVEFGWLTLSSYQWLPGTPGPLDLLPGFWSADANGAHAVFVPEDGVTDPDGEPLSGTLEKQLDEDESIHFVRVGDVLVELGVRDGRYMVRTRNRSHPTLREFTGVPVFAYDPAFVVQGRFTAFEPPRTVPIGSFREDANFTAELVGKVEFELAGQTHRLAATQNDNGSLVLAFGDATNGMSTAAWRFVGIPAPAADGSVTIDFNRTLNYPMAFSPYAVCPAPAAGNRLDVPVNAGEQLPE